MATPAGISNGTKVILSIDTGGGTYVPLEGEMSHSMAFSKAIIEITNKSSDEFREYLAANGTKSLDVSLESLKSIDAVYAVLRAAWFSGVEVPVRRSLNGLVLDVNCLVESMSDSAGLNEAVKTSLSLKSTGTFTEV